jgi:RNA polymerase sigma factor (sigma-70 family)
MMPRTGHRLDSGNMSEVTRLLAQIDSGNSAAAERLLPLVYEELRRLAAAKLAHEKPGQTLQATALVHEAYLRLVGASASGGREPPDESAYDTRPDQGADAHRSPAFNSRGHFFAAAAEAMRRILIDKARQKLRPKHGGQRHRVNFDQVTASVGQSADDLLALDEALTALNSVAPRKAELVKLRFYAGLTIPDAAAALGISTATAERDWTYARTWLFCRLADEPSPEISSENPSTA